jgi:hypothetical protein
MNPIRAWNRFWFAPVSARPLGAFRVVFGLLILAHLALISVDLDFWYTDAGLFRGDEAALTSGPLRPSILHYYQDPVSVRVALGMLVAVVVAFTLGWRTRLMSVFTYVGMLMFYNRNIATNCGPDQVMMITSFYLMLAPCGAAYSLDARRIARARGTLAEPLILPWAQRFMQLQLCAIYFATAFLKSNGKMWANGTALHPILFNHEVGQFNFEWLAAHTLVINFMAHAALAIEFAIVFLLWFRPTRRWIALLGVALHVGIWPIVNVPLFGEQMVALYIVFLDPDELAALIAFFRPSTWLGREKAKMSLVIPGRVDGAHGLPAWKQLELAFDAEGASIRAA